jgi:hypothetical protein
LLQFVDPFDDVFSSPSDSWNHFLVFPPTETKRFIDTPRLLFANDLH